MQFKNSSIGLEIDNYATCYTMFNYSNDNVYVGVYRSHTSKSSNMERDVWSGDKNRTTNYNLGSDSTVTISMGAENDGKKQEAAKEVPVWMSQSTVEGGQEDSRVSRHKGEGEEKVAAERVNRGEGVRIGRKGVRKMIGLVYDMVSRYRWDWVGERER